MSYNMNGNRYKTVWHDGYIAILICDNDTWRLEGNRKAFNSLDKLEAYYKGKILTFERL